MKKFYLNQYEVTYNRRNKEFHVWDCMYEEEYTFPTVAQTVDWIGRYKTILPQHIQAIEKLTTY